MCVCLWELWKFLFSFCFACELCANWVSPHTHPTFRCVTQLNNKLVKLTNCRCSGDNKKKYHYKLIGIATKLYIINNDINNKIRTRNMRKVQVELNTPFMLLYTTFFFSWIFSLSLLIWFLLFYIYAYMHIRTIPLCFFQPWPGINTLILGTL